MTLAQQAPPSGPRTFTRDGISFEVGRESYYPDRVAYVLRGYVFSEAGKILARGHAASSPSICGRGWVNAEGCDAYAHQSRTLSGAVKRMTAYCLAQAALPEIRAQHHAAALAERKAYSALWRSQRLGLPESEARAAALVMKRRKVTTPLLERMTWLAHEAGMCSRCLSQPRTWGGVCSDCRDDMAS